MSNRTAAVIGLGQFGFELAKSLALAGLEVIAIDNDETKVRDIAEFVAFAVQTDASDPKSMAEAGVAEADLGIVAIGEMEPNILAVMVLKELGLGEILAKAITPMHGQILRQLGASKVIEPEREIAQRLAKQLAHPNVLEFVELSDEFSLAEVPALEWMVGKTLVEMNLRSKFGVSVIGIRRHADPHGLVLNPLAGDKIEAKDALVLLGREKDITKLV
ncbi:MAG: hypothetical protein A2600_11435 [Candidatus Lambdaproteobacteria bacterium RIFOXYD1_FULL_56_27]|uniref:Potassium transporter TrkA n=1 Tax=Candidatus Lambdaproteobacteria bacterium RIFOXYD2_FULL_56_26 TaxID=1817773 RepID=A0A1F6H0R4_9PROT|nr:MAG: hypothetical protein A2426_12565 [Candidatus Lambdaproteobacteria bacterium RIFOXYC1_FULL_56_13]OGH03983.1 MAG: hypothetical protein A2557_11195 [Candidatus Lambdaproteobacteria bacterium RIFOXYD2_FULL_56_26]OGH08374.1 MAG: hypothetical protein A2600_11435 [Candidatus Lambdaproteobacteria bacterium RIFOXYD1_FULL_56_27]